MARSPFPDFKKYPQLSETIGHLAERLFVGQRERSTQDYLETLLSFCPNIVDLAIWMFLTKSLFPILDKLPLSTHFDDFTYEDILTRPFFGNLTHLDILVFMGDTWDENYEALVHLPNLTHLSIGCWVEVDMIPKLLRHCRLLRLLIINPDSARQYLKTDNEGRLAEINDYCLVFLEILPFPALVQD